MGKKGFPVFCLTHLVGKPMFTRNRLIFSGQTSTKKQLLFKQKNIKERLEECLTRINLGLPSTGLNFFELSQSSDTSKVSPLYDPRLINLTKTLKNASKELTWMRNHLKRHKLSEFAPKQRLVLSAENFEEDFKRVAQVLSLTSSAKMRAFDPHSCKWVLTENLNLGTRQFGAQIFTDTTLLTQLEESSQLVSKVMVNAILLGHKDFPEFVAQQLKTHSHFRVSNLNLILSAIKRDNNLALPEAKELLASQIETPGNIANFMAGLELKYRILNMVYNTKTVTLLAKRYSSDLGILTKSPEPRLSYTTLLNLTFDSLLKIKTLPEAKDFVRSIYQVNLLTYQEQIGLIINQDKMVIDPDEEAALVSSQVQYDPYLEELATLILNISQEAKSPAWQALYADEGLRDEVATLASDLEGFEIKELSELTFETTHTPPHDTTCLKYTQLNKIFERAQIVEAKTQIGTLIKVIDTGKDVDDMGDV